MTKIDKTICNRCGREETDHQTIEALWGRDYGNNKDYCPKCLIAYDKYKDKFKLSPLHWYWELMIRKSYLDQLKFKEKRLKSLLQDGKKSIQEFNEIVNGINLPFDTN